ncbi:hypothetical protein RJT34_15699 [Clitoria ternatea]|uniref:Uncharacterized protein n=1 Tax=Clitoria ternatea TaxID=43366 RepID=A0AAN9J5X1_CLITE
MAKPTPIRPWSRLASLGTVDSLPKPHSQPSQDNNANASKSPPTLETQNSMHSQKLKFTTPFTFPPNKLKVNPQIENNVTVEERPKMVNKTIENANVNANGNGSSQKESVELQKQGIGHYHKKDNAKENETKGKIVDTKVSGSEGNGMRVIKIAGENRGAYMQITHSQKKSIYKTGNSDNGEEVNAKRKDKSKKVGKVLSTPPMIPMYLNSNVQCVNNSIVFNSSCTHHDPGLHLTLSNKQFDKHVDGQSN